MSEPIRENGKDWIGEDDLVPYSSEEVIVRPRSRSWAWLAWIVILLLVLFIVIGRTAPALDKDAAKQEQPAEDAIMKLQGRYLIGAEDVLGKKHVTLPDKLRLGNVNSHLRFVILTGELKGPAAALKELELLDKEMTQHKVRAAGNELKMRNLLGQLYRDYDQGRLDAPSLKPADQKFLRRQLGWFGKLALAPAGPGADNDKLGPAAGAAAVAGLPRGEPPDPQEREEVMNSARRTFGVLFGAVMAGLFLALCGLIGLLVFVVLGASGVLRWKLQTGTGRGPIYAETFACWLALFLGLSWAGSRLSFGVPVLIQIAVFDVLSLGALAWPVLRGIPWHEVRQDVGLTFGRHPVLEPAFGIICYVMALPLLLLGVLLTLVLLLVQQALAGPAGDPFVAPSQPVHPIVAPLAQGGLESWLTVVLLASVAAPLVEETMFRGVLYRHLREATARFGWFLSFLASALMVSFLFAIVHPQGLIAIPPLMALAFGFSLAREWRGTLIPGMVGHALNNGIVTLLLTLIFAD